MKLKKAKLWRILWRQKSLTQNLAEYYATSYDDVDQGSGSSSRSSVTRSSSSDTSLGSIFESTSMSNNDTNSNGEVYGSRGNLMVQPGGADVSVLRKKRSETGSSAGSGGKSRPKSLPVENMSSSSRSHSKHKHSNESNDEHNHHSKHRSSSKLSSEDEMLKMQQRHASRVHSIQEIPESNLTKSCDVTPVSSRTKRDMKKSHSVAVMSSALETPTSSRSRDFDVIPATRRISTSSHESDDVMRRASSKNSKISNIEETTDDHNNNHEHKSKKSKKKDKDRDKEREKEKSNASPPHLRPKHLDLNITVQEGGNIKVTEEDEDIGNVSRTYCYYVKTNCSIFVYCFMLLRCQGSVPCVLVVICIPAL